MFEFFKPGPWLDRHPFINNTRTFEIFHTMHIFYVYCECMPLSFQNIILGQWTKLNIINDTADFIKQNMKSFVL